MNYSRIYRLSALTVCVASVFGIASCNQDYDISKFDGTIAIGQGLDIPMGVKDTFEVKLSSILGSAQGSMLQEDKDGNYLLSMEMDPCSVQVQVPGMSVPGFNSTLGDLNLPIPSIPSNVVFSTLQDNTIKVPCSSENNAVEIEKKDLTGMVQAIQYLDGQATYTFTMQVPAITNVKGFTIANDFCITVPVWLRNPQCQTSGFKIENGKIAMTSSTGYYVNCGTSFNVVIKIDGIDFTKFDGTKCKFVAGTPGKFDGQILIHDNVSVTANLLIKESDITAYPVPAQDKVIGMKSDFSDFNISKAMAKVTPDLSGIGHDPMVIDQSSLPELITKDGAVIDAAGDFDLNIEIKNPFPVDIDFSAQFAVTSNNSKYSSVKMGYGVKNGQSAINAKANQTSSFSLKRNLADTDKEVSLLYALPKTINIEGFDLTQEDKFAEINAGSDYRVEFGCGFESKLAFGPMLNIEYDYDLTGLNLNLDGIELSDLTLNMEIVNSLPVTIGITPAALDSDGKLIPGVEVDANLTLAPGSLQSPSVNDASIKLTVDSAETLSNLNGLRLNLRMTNGNGTPLNSNQGVVIRKISIHTDNGIIFNL